MSNSTGANAHTNLDSYSYGARNASDPRATEKQDEPLRTSRQKPEDVPRRKLEQQAVVAGATGYQTTGNTRHLVQRGTLESGLKNLNINQPATYAASKRSHAPKSSQEDILPAPTEIAKLETGTYAEIDFKNLTGLSEQFVSIPEKDYTGKAEFLAEFPELLKTNLENLYVEAVHQMRIDHYEVARQCISALVIIRQCANLKNRSDLIENRVNALNDPRTERAAGYRELFAAVEEDVRAAAKKGDTSSKSKQRDSDDEVTVPSRRKTRQNERSAPTLNPIRDIENVTTESSGKLRVLSTEDLLQEIDEKISAKGAKVFDAIQIPAGDFDEGDTQKLSSAYRVYDRASTFFIPGRVFSMLWHEPAGRTYKKQKGVVDELTEPDDGYYKARLSRNTTVGPYGEKIYSHIRRMIVIRNRPAYCWCISIGTYGGQGLKKRGLQKADIDAHAIVYDSRLEPKYLPKEPETPKMPIAVNLKPGQTLSEASRLHYGKPMTVEFNTPVLDCGMVRKDHIAILLSEVRGEMLGDQTQTQRP